MTLSDVLNAPTELEFEGTTYRLRQPNQMERGEYEQWVKKRSFDEIERREYKDEARRDRAHNLLVQDISAGVYDFDGVVVTKSFKDDNCFGKLLSIVLRDQGVTHEIGRRMMATARKQVMFAVTRRVFTDPKDWSLVAQLLELPGVPDSPAHESKSSSSSSIPRSTDTTSEASPTTNSSAASTSSEAPVASPS
ncbi:MAG: hypothetical protein C0467_25305 [Planctomycetaceae bacterium]|nr:hypothetical protein [Planctomycetaceae bacterium]